MKRWVPSLMVFALGCSAFDPVVIREQEKLPDVFAGLEAQAGAGVRLEWNEWFQDPQLEALVNQALEHNQSLAMAVERVEVARAGVTRSTGALFPRLDLGIGAGVRKYGLYTMDGAGNATTDILPNQRVPVNLGDFALSLQTNWEADVWGKLRNQKNAASAQWLASLEGVHFVATSLVAEVATAWFELQALDRTREVLARSVVQQHEALEVVRTQRSVGRASELSVKQFEAQWLQTRALEIEVAQQVLAAENRLNVLLGRFPQPITRPKLEQFEAAGRSGAGVPAELLRNRPDVREAEQRLAATKFDVKSAQAAFFPSINLSIGVGVQSFDPAYLVRLPESLIYNLLGGLVAPLLNRSAIEAQLDGAKAFQREAMYGYQRTVLEAYVEVVNSLANHQSTGRALELKKEQQAAVTEMVSTADSLYRAGKVSSLEVLIAQQNAMRGELELVETWRRQQVAAVTLYKALGGGWKR
ncbi:MAG: efflux transporter outer membrane subunit [Archangium sp.]|nr:efflux transporter outer membrane subunit [Archangium sp.]MDP3152275.1 efflux transporter outer membrane subunit [Archangium sp.]MDP3570671.1 efflux transporter outer membrane subunit [Archangium sp.]